MRVVYEKGFLYIRDLAEITAKAVGATYLKGKKAWRIPANTHSMRELYKAQPNAGLSILGREQKAKEDILLSRKRLDEATGDERLRSYQRVDVQFLKRLPHAAIFNQQRTGKTPTALNVVKDEYDLVIIVCPASLLLQWEKEVKTWVNDSITYVSKGTKKQREKIYESLSNVGQRQDQSQSFLIISYETMRNDLNLVVNVVTNYGKSSVKNMDVMRNDLNVSSNATKHSSMATISLIVDEAHRLANHRSQQSKALYTLSKHVNKRLALTGTPAMNHPGDVFGILHFLYPKLFSSYWQFVERYFHIHEGYWGKDIGDYRRKEELQLVLDLISVQRKRKDVMSWLPEKEYQTYDLEPTDKQKRVYKSVLETFEYEEDGVEIDAPSLLAQLTRLRQITLAPEVLEIDATSAKEKWLMEWLDDNPNEPVIIFSNFTSYLKILSKKLKRKNVMIHGELSADEKQSAADAFQEGKAGTNILLSNIKAGGVGWTLDRATTTIFLDRHYNPAINEQAEDRMVSTKEGYETGNLVIDLVLKDTIDEHILQLIKDKVDIIKYVNDYGMGAILNGRSNSKQRV